MTMIDASKKADKFLGSFYILRFENNCFLTDSPEGAWRLKRNEWSEETYRPLPAGELLQGTSVKPPEMWPESALTTTSEGEAPSHAEWKALA